MRTVKQIYRDLFSWCECICRYTCAQAQVKRIKERGAAAGSGISPGDIVVGLDGRDVGSLDSQELTEAMLGPLGAPECVMLLCVRPSKLPWAPHAPQWRCTRPRIAHVPTSCVTLTHSHICMYVCMYLSLCVCLCVCVCMYVCMYVCLCVCMRIHV